MFKQMKQAARDAGTLRTLCESAEAIARQEGLSAPAAEHFVEAALALPDGAAKRVFARLGLDGAGFSAALSEQEREALRAVGVDGVVVEQALGKGTPLPLASGLYEAAPSGQVVVQELARLRQRGVTGPLDGAQVMKVVAEMGHGSAVRALRAMGVGPEAVVGAADAEIADEAARHR
ncbi:Clp protease N-terminal domain-containing protein [Devosia sediminis]|uniref:Peptidase n=1 Tax=Devosia sediminis TaxID=2798801 RepID=A0A934IXY1_9HYPH|nr:Clp protease N-terminal domain-containing protein [Devosia sediminis]MBJ3785231.1 hypothetical protein [Devosia sediminis]